jgi:hypothetical protein
MKFDCFFDAAAVASAAFRCGRREVASQLAQIEKNPAKLAFLYIKMQLWSEAIKAAADSSDTSLFLDVLGKILAQSRSDQGIAGKISLDICSYSIVAKIVDKDRNHEFAPLLQKTEVPGVTLVMRLRELPTNETFPESLGRLRQHYEQVNKNLKVSWLSHQISMMRLLEKRLAAIERMGQEEKRTIPGVLANMTVNETIEYLAIVKQGEGTKSALKFGVKRMKMERSRVIMVICGMWRRQKKWELCKAFAGSQYSKEWGQIIAMLYYCGGKQEALDFVNGTKADAAEQERLRGEIENGELGFG